MGWICSYEQMCEELGVRNDERIAKVVKILHSEGFSDKGIFYAIGKNRAYLRTKNHEHYFYGLLINTVRRNAHSKNDTAFWNEFNYKKRMKTDKEFAKKERKRHKDIEKMTIHKNDKESKDRVYFVQAGEYIKIGYTSNIQKRLDSLQTGQPLEIKCLCLIKGDRRVESSLHKKFGEYRVRREWFSMSDELMQYIQTLKDNDMDLSFEVSINYSLLGKPKYQRGDIVRITDVNDSGLRLEKPTPTHIKGFLGQILTNFIAEDNVYAYDVLLNDLFGEGAVEIVSIREENLSLLIKGNGEVR
jgi:hypothetical protein